MLFLVILLLVLTGVYMNLAPVVTRPDIMGIVYVSALASTPFARLATNIDIRGRCSASNLSSSSPINFPPNTRVDLPDGKASRPISS